MSAILSQLYCHATYTLSMALYSRGENGCRGAVARHLVWQKLPARVTALSRTGLLDFLGGAGAEFVDKISGFLRVRGGGENRPAVVLQDFQPVGDIGGVVFAGLQRQFKVGTQEGCAQFGDQFFLGIGVAAEAVAAEVTVQAGFAACPVR